MTGKIYKIYNNINDKIYIGKTISTLEERFTQHKRDSIRTRYEKRPLYDAMNKYGKEHFFIELIEECDLQDLSTREIYWIEKFNSYHYGYNATRGGDGKILYDYQLIIDLYQNGLTGKEISNLINCDSDVVLKALRSANIDTRINAINLLSKKVAAYDKNHNLIMEFNSEAEAARWLIEKNIAKTNDAKHVGSVLGRAANGQRKTAYKMYWEFIN